jgi:chaperonin GroES
MAFTPLHDRVLVRRIESDEKTKGGLIIPDSAKEKPAEGEVIAVGAGAKDDDGDRIAMDVKAGDRILFGKWSGTEITLDGEELLIMKESRHPRHHRLSVPPAARRRSGSNPHPIFPRRVQKWQPRTSSLTPMPATAC